MGQLAMAQQSNKPTNSFRNSFQLTIFAGALAGAIFLPAGLRSQEAAAKPVDFQKDVQPILAKKCVACHQGGAAPADLRLDSPAAISAGSISGKVIVSGNAAASLLVQRITAKTGVGMPPTGPLPDDEIALITAWVDQGAKMDSPASDLFSTKVQPIF